MKQIALSLALMLAAPALAAELEGVKVPETVTVGGKELQLNGVGLRTKFWIKVYVAALYTAEKSTDPNALIAADTPKRVRMVMLRDLDKKSIVDAIREGFDKNAKAQLPALQKRLDDFIAQIPDIKKGEVLELSYIPGQGTQVTTKSGDAASIEGKDFADALFSVWLGRSPVDEDLKRGMLGVKK